MVRKKQEPNRVDALPYYKNTKILSSCRLCS